MRALFLCLIMSALARAQAPQSHAVEFRVWPPGSSIKIANSGKVQGFLGRSGTRMELDSSLVPSGTVTLTFEHPGYKAESRDVKGRLLLSSELWPPPDQPEVRLVPASSAVALRDAVQGHPWLTSFLSLGLTGLLAGELWRRHSHRLALRRARRAEDEAIQRAATLEASLDPSLSVSLNGYRIVRELGKGGMATVYEVVKEPGQEALALKLLHREISENPDAIKRVRREVRIWRELLHPGIVPLVDFGEINGRYYFVMDKVDGESLQSRLRQGRVRPGDAVRWTDALFEAVAYAHARGVIHRDLKPDNIMLRQDGRLQVLDFGISRSIDQHTQVTVGDAVLGTPAYMAPERFSGTTDFASDQYALGLICFELFTGTFALGDDKDVGVLLSRHFNFVPPPMSSLDPRIPAELDRIVSRMLEKDPTRRFPSLMEARQALHAALGKRGREILAAPP
ncbi:MAG: serine/threonine-protein kinase [Vulcanimicrobiota bacterium]